MWLNSLVYVFYFLPIALLFYFICPKKHQASLLIILSVLFFGFQGSGKILHLLIFVIFLSLACFFIRKFNAKQKIKKSVFLGSLLILVLACFVFKFKTLKVLFLNDSSQYTRALNTFKNTLGLGFLALSCLHLIIQTYKNKTKNFSIKEQLSFLLFFPKLCAPYYITIDEFSSTWNNRKPNVEFFAKGIRMLFLGFILHSFFALQLAQIGQDVFSTEVNLLNTYSYILGFIAATLALLIEIRSLHLICEGTSLLLGIDFNEPNATKTAFHPLHFLIPSAKNWIISTENLNRFKQSFLISIVSFLFVSAFGRTINDLIFAFFVSILVFVFSILKNKIIQNITFFLVFIPTLFILITFRNFSLPREFFALFDLSGLKAPFSVLNFLDNERIILLIFGCFLLFITARKIFNLINKNLALQIFTDVLIIALFIYSLGINITTESNLLLKGL